MLPPYASLAMRLTQAELGDVATWIGSVANVATLGLALAAGIVSFRIYKIESDRDRRAEDERRERALDERRAQAELVSTWFAKDEESLHRRKIVWGRVLWGAIVLNSSNLPIYDVVVFFRPKEAANYPHQVDGHGIPGEAIRVVPPHQGTVMVDMPEAMDALPAENRLQLVDVSMEFRDSAGRRWLRDWNGFLLDITPTAEGLRASSPQARRARHFS
ncbi:hypothetical protein [Micromonospora haikouensis]|uniref:hypothetical protein n=1 Tax=Micromonospora haikouensis TaxID=686309 RepID=UPI003D733A1E